ncbi:MAG: DNA mismatch repair protein MutS [Hyphomicrobiales bacterium]|mgnify:CR=1 FL=1|nr:MAG: DNA mismatch repair protein MutS [Hyphomicrobiales bacterium]
MSRRKRQLSEDERALWHKVASTARPLDGARFESLASVETRSGPAHQSGGPEAAAGWFSASESHLPPAHRNGYASDSKPGSGLNSLDRRASRRLERGRVSIDARLDLHGLTQHAAHQALLGFLQRARRNDIRHVLVITGKSGVLNRLVPIWLAEPMLRAHVGAVSGAAARHGGQGALYIRLRRQG